MTKNAYWNVTAAMLVLAICSFCLGNFFGDEAGYKANQKILNDLKLPLQYGWCFKVPDENGHTVLRWVTLTEMQFKFNGIDPFKKNGK